MGGRIVPPAGAVGPAPLLDCGGATMVRAGKLVACGGIPGSCGGIPAACGGTPAACGGVPLKGARPAPVVGGAWPTTKGA